MTHTTASTSHINNVTTRNEVQRLLTEYDTHGDFFSYPVVKETGTFTGTDPVYELISGIAQVIAYAFIWHTTPTKRSAHFTVVMLDKSGRVKCEMGASTYTLDSSVYLTQWVNATEMFYPALAPATPAKAIATHKRSAKEDFLAACAAAPRPAKDKPKESINSKVLATPVGKKTKAAKTPGTARNTSDAAKLPSADELRKIAKTQNVDTTSVNFRSSTQRAALAKQLGLV